MANWCEEDEGTNGDKEIRYFIFFYIYIDASFGTREDEVEEDCFTSDNREGENILETQRTKILFLLFKQ